MEAPLETKPISETHSLRDLSLLFLKLGTTAFGGPAAHTAMMEDEVVRRRNWFSHAEFLEMVAATNLIPGPSSTQLAIYIGLRRNGVMGLVSAGLCFILPAVVLTLLIGMLYERLGGLTEFTSVMFGIRAAVVAIVLATVYRLGNKTMRDPFNLLLGLAIAMLFLFHVNEILLLFFAGLAGVAWSNRHHLKRSSSNSLGSVLLLLGIPAIAFPVVARSGVVGETLSLSQLGLSFLKIGATLYGGGYVLLAFLQHEFVDLHQWLSQSQLMDAVAIGQFTPGPVLSTATFVGYLLLGLPGPGVATVAIFLPSFLFVFVLGRLVTRLKSSKLLRGFLDGVQAAALGLMLGVAVTLGLSGLTSPIAIGIFLVSLLLLFRTKLNTIWIIAGSGAIGYLSRLAFP